MPNQFKSHQALYGIKARRDYLMHIISEIEASARLELLHIEANFFHDRPSTTEESRLFEQYIDDETESIKDAAKEASACLKDIEDMGEEYVEDLPVTETVPGPSTAEATRHVPVLGIDDQDTLWRIALTTPHPSQSGAWIFTEHSPEHISYAPRFAHPSLDRLIAATERAVFARDVPDLSTFKKQDFDITVVDDAFDEMDRLITVRPDGYLAEDREGNRNSAHILWHVLELTQEKKYNLEEVRAALPNEAAAAYLKAVQTLAASARRRRENPVAVRGGRVPGEGQAGSSKGPGTLAEDEGASVTARLASVESEGEASVDAAAVPLPDSDSAYGSGSSTRSVEPARE